MTDNETKYSVERHFQAWSKPIGVVLFLVLAYLSKEGVDVQDMAWAVIILILGGNEIIETVLKRR